MDDKNFRDVIAPNPLCTLTHTPLWAKVQQSGGQPLCEESSSGATTQEEWNIDFSSLSPAERAQWVSIVLPTTPEIPPLTVLEVVQLGRLPHRHASLSQRDATTFVDSVLHRHASLSQRDATTFVDSVLHRHASLAQRDATTFVDNVPASLRHCPSGISPHARPLRWSATARDVGARCGTRHAPHAPRRTHQFPRFPSHPRGVSVSSPTLAHEEKKLVIVATHISIGRNTMLIQSCSSRTLESI